MGAWWLYLAGSSVGFTLGSLLLKRFADTGAWTAMALSFTVFAVSNLLFAQVLRTGLGQGVVVSRMSQIIVMVIMGVLIFGERVTLSQSAGVALAFLNIFLILNPGATEV